VEGYIFLIDDEYGLWTKVLLSEIFLRFMLEYSFSLLLNNVKFEYFRDLQLLDVKQFPKDIVFILLIIINNILFKLLTVIF
jgi:hypothetical protein